MVCPWEEVSSGSSYSAILTSNLYNLFPSAGFGVFFVLLSLIALGARLGCLFEMFPVS